MSKYTIFISDLHLSSNKPKTANLFLKFIKNTAPQAESLYILGDFFKFWAGDDDRSEFNEKIKAALKILGTKIPVYLMPGNRDFILGQGFALDANCILIPDPCNINLYKNSIVLTHGDILCTKDIKHRIFRTITRIPFGIIIFLKLPLRFRIWLASYIQKYSALIKSKSLKNKNYLLPQIGAIKKLITQYKANQIIHGHIHNAENEELVINNKKIIRISLGEWLEDSGSFLVYYQNEQFKFESFEFN